MIRSAAPDDFTSGGFTLLQIAHPIGREVQILQLRQVNGFRVRHIGRR
jgi:hypothetical protein